MRLRRLFTAGLIVALMPVIALESVADTQPLPQLITLVTGDRVVIRGKDVSLLPAKGRAGIAVHTYEIAGHSYVVPMDAANAVASGRLDRRLFDITALQEFGYAEGQDIPLIFTGRSHRAVRLQKGQAWQAVKDSQDKVWLDGKRKITLADSVPQVGGPAAWEAGYTGKGVTVAVLDTGIDATHPDLAGRIADVRNFTSEKDGDDTVGHGTHVASTIAGSGAASNGKYRGVAPDATLVIGKVCAKDGCPESAILAGMEWAAKEKKAQVVNLSLGGPNTQDVDVLEAAIDQLTAETGTLFVVAAGNNGFGPEKVSSPSTADAALSVGAVSKSDTEEFYSNRGPRLADGAVKPEIAAPGTAIVAARARNSGRPPVDQAYTTMSGTSMATPHVAGAAALLAQRRPSWHASELKGALVSAAQPTQQADVFAEGAGRVDVARAVKQDVTATTSTVNLGLQHWPHEDDKPATGMITYRNSGSAPVTLTLTVTDAHFTTDKEITVPAGGQASATVTADTRTGPDGRFSGRVVATAGDTRILTPVTVNKEVESYDLELTQIGRDGKPAAIDGLMVLAMESPQVDSPYDPDGTVTLRRPKGKYFVDTFIEGKDGLTHIHQPLLVLDHDTTLTLDARTAKLVRPTVRDVNAGVAMQDIGLLRFWDTPEGRAGFRSGMFQFGSDQAITPVYTAQSGPPVAKEDLQAWVSFRLGDPGPEGDFLNSPYVYHLMWGFTGTYPTGHAPLVERREFAAVRQHYHALTDGKYGYNYTSGSAGGVRGLAAVPLGVTLPFERTDYYQADGRTWKQNFAEADVRLGLPTISNTAGPEETLVAGRTYERHWNRGVFGPAFTPTDAPSGYRSIRNGDGINISAPEFSDGTPGRFGYAFRRKASRIALYRDGTLVVERDDFFQGWFADQPVAEATYRAEIDLQLDESTHPLSSRTHTAWTFKSAHTPEIQALPLLVPRISPALDSQNAARADRLLVLPVRIDRNPGSASSPLADVTVESSFDGGATWRKVPVFRAGDTFYGLAANATTSGFASLRVTATDKAGNKVEQTTIHAYKISH